MKIAILGGGAWGRALATLAAEAGSNPHIGYRSAPVRGFPGSPNLSGIAREHEVIFIAVPPAAVRTVVQQAKLGPEHRVIIAARGIEPQTGTWLSKIVLEESSALRVGALAGPALADEVLKGNPTAMVIGSAYEELTRLTQHALHSRQCRIYSSKDLIGIELAGAMVGALSLALGVVDGLNQGVGVRGVVVTRGIAEAIRLGQSLGAEEQSFTGLAGIGDLVSCGSLSSNSTYAAGRQLGSGRSCTEQHIQILKSILNLAKKQGVEIPLTSAIYAIAKGKLRPELALDMLMRREATAEY